MNTVEQSIDNTRVKTVEERIDAGIKLLDSHFGPGWEDRIDLENFTIGSCEKCIVGNLLGDYTSENLITLGLSCNGIDGLAHGFMFDSAAEVPILNEAWRYAILNLEKNRRVDVEREHFIERLVSL